MASKLLQRRLPLIWAIAWRYMLGDRSQILSSTAWAAFIATTLGVTAMVIAMALMTGYTEDLQHKLIGLQGEVIASPLVQGGFESYAAELERAGAVPGVARMGRVAYGEGSISSAGSPEGVSVVLRGVEPGYDPTVRKIASGDPPALLEPGEDGIPGALLGTELQRQLSVEPGDVLRLVVLDLTGTRPRFRYRSVRFADSFSTGFAEFDASWIILDGEVLRRARGDTGLDVMEFKLEDPERTEQIAAGIERELGSDWMVQRWQKLNRQLFAALKLQEWALFFVLGVIVVVSTFNVASTLVILVRERMRDIGVLASLGLSPRELWWVFATYGLSLGAMGTLSGVLLGGGAAWLITELELIRFGPEIAAIYFIDSVPFRVELTDVLAIVTFSLTVTLIACSVPAFRAARVNPSVALRDE
ncbi:MAG: ABC transporter permease [bacterium]|nr:ABC transporter permease [bacterium]